MAKKSFCTTALEFCRSVDLKYKCSKIPPPSNSRDMHARRDIQGVQPQLPLPCRRISSVPTVSRVGYWLAPDRKALLAHPSLVNPYSSCSLQLVLMPHGIPSCLSPPHPTAAPALATSSTQASTGLAQLGSDRSQLGPLPASLTPVPGLFWPRAQDS